MSSSESDGEAYGPSLPPSASLPQDRTEGKSSSSGSEDDMYGPALPPHLLNKDAGPPKRRVLGPSLPRGYVPPEESQEVSEEDDEEEEAEGPTIGPSPSGQEFNEKEYRIKAFELRAKKMKDKIEGKDKDPDEKPLARETWMLELPEDKANFCGLAPRQFLRKTPREKGDRSVWTDTPADKDRKEKMGVEEKREPDPVPSASKRRDEELTEKVSEYNKAKRAKPLIDMHRKSIKKKEDKSKPKERRPFSREEDLNVNRFDEAQKKTILKKAQKLNDRFSAGDRKFL